MTYLKVRKRKNNVINSFGVIFRMHQDVVYEYPQIKRRRGATEEQERRRPLLAVVIYSLYSSELE